MFTLVDCDEGFWGLAETWIDDPPVFARHICPVDLTYPLIATPRDLSRLSEAAVDEYADLLDPEVSFSVQSRILLDLPYKPFDVNRAVSAALARATNSPLDVRQPVSDSVGCLRSRQPGSGIRKASSLKRWATGLPGSLACFAQYIRLGRRRAPLPPRKGANQPR